MATFHFLWLASPHKQKLEGAAVLTAVLFVSEMAILEMNKWKEIGDLQWLCHPPTFLFYIVAIFGYLTTV